MTTLEDGVLVVGSAYPDPPFDVLQGDVHGGFDIDMMTAVANHLGLHLVTVAYQGDNFEGIFGPLGTTYDCVVSGTTVTEPRKKLALFCAPYVRSGQSLVVDVARTPDIRSVDDLSGRTVGIQRGNTSDIVARKLKEEGRLGDIRYYAYHDILLALEDLEAGHIDGFIKLAPVMHWLTHERPHLEVVQQDLTTEFIAAAVALGNTALQTAIDGATRQLAADGTLDRLAAKWLSGSGAEVMRQM